MAAEARFRAMGSDAHVVVVGDAGLLDVARRRVDDLEQRWSRFLPDSEISRLNRGRGAPLRVSRETIELVRRAVDGWQRTGGRFDIRIDDLSKPGPDQARMERTGNGWKTATAQLSCPPDKDRPFSIYLVNYGVGKAETVF